METKSTPSGSFLRRNGVKLLVVAAIAAAFGAFFAFGGSQYLSLEYLKARQADIMAYYGEHPVVVIGVFLVVYVVSTGLSLPGAAILTILAGALFGRWIGTLIVSFASTSGATLAFLASRFLIGNSVQARFGRQLEGFNRGIEREGPFFLFTLRLIPAVPFFVINLVMGVTRIRTLTFWWVSQLGMLAGTFVYVNAGTELARIDSPSGLLSPTLLVSFAVLGAFPFLVRFAFRALGKKPAKVMPEEAAPAERGGATAAERVA
jgi:uncharacterized membrane protein YdjX (TVP38/TMEM64 family)